VARAGGLEEMAGEATVDLTGGSLAVSINKMGPGCWWGVAANVLDKHENPRNREPGPNKQRTRMHLYD
jgi:hypothetical protein